MSGYDADNGSANPAFRTFLAFWLIAWFCIFVLAAVAGLVLALVFELLYLGRPGVFTLAGVALVLLVVRWIYFLVDRGHAPGVLVDEGSQARLLETVRQVAGRIGGRMPERVLVIPDAGIVCIDRCRFPGVKKPRGYRDDSCRSPHDNFHILRPQPDHEHIWLYP